MNKQFILLATTLLFSMSFFSVEVNAQTNAIGEVQKIEALAKEFTKNNEEIARLKEAVREERAKRDGEPAKLRKEIADLEKERDNIIADMKAGARCSQCKEWKSALEKKGINFKEHLGQVKGYAIPATTEELESVRASYREKIAYKKVQLKRLEEKLNQPLPQELRLRELTNRNAGICTEMRTASDRYEQKVLASAKSKHESWGNALMTKVTDWLIYEDKRAIAAQKQVALQREQRTKEDALKKQVAEKLEAEIKEYERQVATTGEEINLLRLNWEAAAKEIGAKRKEAADEREIIKRRIDTTKNDSVRLLLEKEHQQHDNMVKDLDAELKRKKDASDSKIKTATSSKAKLEQYIGQLRANGPVREREAVAKLKTEYDVLIKAAYDEEQVAKSRSKLAGENYTASVRTHEELQQELRKTIAEEEMRIRNAGLTVSCTVGSSASGKVHSNWNTALGCVDNVKAYAKKSASHIFNSYCNSFDVKSALQQYRGYLSGLSVAEREIVKEISNPMWLKELAPW